MCKLDVVVVVVATKKRLSRVAGGIVVRADAEQLFISVFSGCLWLLLRRWWRYFYGAFEYLIVVYRLSAKYYLAYFFFHATAKSFSYNKVAKPYKIKLNSH